MSTLSIYQESGLETQASGPCATVFPDLTLCVCLPGLGSRPDSGFVYSQANNWARASIPVRQNKSQEEMQLPLDAVPIVPLFAE